ncbi:hypothetical protein CLOP_g16584 [Closterium sp. NIES-67]|nr:hypothetical protein CLOP_g19127 [Closterium sp. NIES-67]GJP69047.1 hypothetical protein CLOP_g25674 [Closterium sp. NIES-67]GJP77037.1 hypothetical protein CLOP_g7470 [Closterium sp. NIES-67]GJP86577.1 hypothetical protein CLOP_g16584 [Closterium sp. NIES-67]
MAIPPHDRMEWTAKGQFVKATPHEWLFSDVSIKPADGVGPPWYGRALVLFHYLDDAGVEGRAAYIQYYTEHPRPCPDTGCKRLSPTTGIDNYAVIDMDCILSLAHVVPSCTEPEYRLVNRFLF